MNVRVKAFLQTFGGLAAGAATVLFLDFISPKYGFTIFLSGVMLYILWVMYNFRVSMLEREQNEVVETLKK